MNDAPMIRVATPDDAARLSRTLAAAFLEDPALAFMIPNEQRRKAILPGFFRGIVNGALRNGMVLRSPGHRAVSIWRLPGAIGPSRAEILRSLPSMARLAGAAGKRAGLLSQTIAAHRPKHEFRYLQFAGTRPEYQGTGLGSAVVGSGLERATAGRVPVYLETATSDNVPFYERHGFKLTGSFVVPQGGPEFQQMEWRP